MKEKASITFRDLVEFAFLPVLSAGVFVLWDLNKNVNSLNIQVGVLVAQTTSSKERLDSFEKRLEKLEDKIRGNHAPESKE